jgi:membrane-bound lytic murein transglycosylase B
VSRLIVILVGLAILLASSPLVSLDAAGQTPAPATTEPTQTTAPAGAQPPAAEPAVPFDQWLEALLAEARERGFSEPLLQQTLVGVQPRPRVIENDRSQPELTPGFERYLKTRVTARMTANGKELLKTHQALLGRIEKAYGVQRRFLVAIWGHESRYGRAPGNIPVFEALATLAWEPRRATLFRGELFQALTMVDRGYIDAPTMTGSWAGAMGQPQFMPSSYLKHAVDFDGDSKRNIWTSPPDVLASIANYLKAHAWNGDETWGREVALTPAVREQIAEKIPKRTKGCYAERNMTERRPLDEWRALGVRQRNGSPLPKADIAAGLVDVGERQFLVYPNYDAILGYNCAHYYALSVVLLGDTLR